MELLLPSQETSRANHLKKIHRTIPEIILQIACNHNYISQDDKWSIMREEYI